MRICSTSPSSRAALICSAAALSLSLTATISAQSAFAASGVSASNSADNTATTRPWHETTVPADKQISAKVTDGVFTVDGLVAKVQLNYDIHHADYLYFFVPGLGTAVVSRVDMYGATKVNAGLTGSKLAFNTGGHSFELTSKTPIYSGKTDIYVRLDTAAAGLDRYPMMGYGDTTRAPYNWPLSAHAAKDTEAHFVTPPPLPRSVLPRTAEATSETAKATRP